MSKLTPIDTLNEYKCPFDIQRNQRRSFLCNKSAKNPRPKVILTKKMFEPRRPEFDPVIITLYYPGTKT